MVDIISALGAGSGIDIKALAANLTAAERLPQQAAIDTRKTAAESKISSVGKIMSTVDAFSTAVTGLGNPSTFQRAPTSSDPSSLDISFTGDTVPPTFTGIVSVDVIATESSVLFSSISSLDDSLLGGNTDRTLTLYDGSDNTGDELASFDLSTYDTITKLKDAINAVSGFTATIITGGSTDTPAYYLSVRHGYGADNEFFPELTTTDASGTLSADSDGNYGIDSAVTTAGVDAQITIDGVVVTSSTNTFTDVLTGVTLEALAVTTSDVTISSVTDKTALTNALATLVAGFNELVTTIKTESAYSEDKKLSGALANNSSARYLLQQLNNFTTKSLSGYDGSTSYTLAELGVATNRDGTLSIDNKLFATALRDYPEMVEAVLASKRAVSDSRMQFGSVNTSTNPGSYTVAASDATTWTIAGEPAARNGYLLQGGTGTTAEGITLLLSSDIITSAADGYSTTVYFAKGLVERFADMLTAWKDTSSPINTVEKTASNELDDVTTAQAKLDEKMKSVEQRYIKQFATMQSAVNASNDTKKSLTSMMDAWSASMKG